jgi:hypothetical protein
MEREIVGQGSARADRVAVQIADLPRHTTFVIAGQWGPSRNTPFANTGGLLVMSKLRAALQRLSGDPDALPAGQVTRRRHSWVLTATPLSWQGLSP